MCATTLDLTTMHVFIFPEKNFTEYLYSGQREDSFPHPSIAHNNYICTHVCMCVYIHIHCISLALCQQYITYKL